MELDVLPTINLENLERDRECFGFGWGLTHLEGFVVEHCCSIRERAANSNGGVLIHYIQSTYRHACKDRSYLLTKALLAHSDAAP